MSAFRAWSWLFVIWLTITGGAAARVVGAQTITEFPVPTADSGPWGIAAGPDGALWFTESPGLKIGRITTSGAISEFPVNFAPESIAAGPDGNLWTANIIGDPCIGRITTSGVMTGFTVDLRFCGRIAAGPDGNLWFTETDIIGLGDFVGHIGRITTTGRVTEFPIPTHNSDANVIVAGPDGALWFTEGLYNGGPNPKIGRITTAGRVSEFPVASDRAGGIAAGPDGNLWFTGGNHQIGRMTTGGVVTFFPVSGDFPPDYSPSGTSDITTGPDGALWFTEVNAIGRITTAGVVTEFPMPTPQSHPTGIVAGPDGALWFTERSNNKIGRITTSDLEPVPLPTPTGQHPRLVPFR